jgi:hypothetical protein
MRSHVAHLAGLTRFGLHLIRHQDQLAEIHTTYLYLPSEIKLSRGRGPSSNAAITYGFYILKP